MLQREFAAENFVCRTLRTTGLGESRVQEAVEAGLQPLVARGLGVGYCARPGAVDVRLVVKSVSSNGENWPVGLRYAPSSLRLPPPDAGKKH